MNKREFLAYLRRRLCFYPKSEVDEAIAYYDELICDKVEREGMTEEQAVASFGNKKDIVSECIATIKDKSSGEAASTDGGDVRTGISPASAVAIGILASPLLFPLGIVALTFIFVTFAVWVALVVSLGAVAVGGLVAAVGSWFSSIGAAPTLIVTGTGIILAAVGTAACVALAVYGWKGLSAAVIGIINALRRNRKG